MYGAVSSTTGLIAFTDSPILSKPTVCNHGPNHSSKVARHTKRVIYALAICLVEHEIFGQIQHQHRCAKRVDILIN